MPEQFTNPGTANVSAADKVKLKGLLKKYGKKGGFTACVRDNVANGVSPDHAKRRCAVIKDTALGTTNWRSGGKKKGK